MRGLLVRSRERSRAIDQIFANANIVRIIVWDCNGGVKPISVGIRLCHRTGGPCAACSCGAALPGWVASTAALLLTPGCEVAGAVQVSNDDHFIWAHRVEKPIVEHEKFAQIGLIQFGNDATALGVLIEWAGRVECSNEDSNCGRV